MPACAVISRDWTAYPSVQSTREQYVPAQMDFEQTGYAKLYAEPTMSA